MLGIAMLASCGPSQQVTVTDAWVRLAAVPGRPAAGYVTIRGGATDQTLIAVSTPAAGSVEMHETMRHGSGMTMQPIGALAIPAGATVTFAPGGKHLMLFDMVPAIGKGTAFPMKFTFADGRELRVATRAVAAGDPPPS